MEALTLAVSCSQAKKEEFLQLSSKKLNMCDSSRFRKMFRLQKVGVQRQPIFPGASSGTAAGRMPQNKVRKIDIFKFCIMECAAVSE